MGTGCSPSKQNARCMTKPNGTNSGSDGSLISVASPPLSPITPAMNAARQIAESMRNGPMPHTYVGKRRETYAFDGTSRLTHCECAHAPAFVRLVDEFAWCRAMHTDWAPLEVIFKDLCSRTARDLLAIGLVRLLPVSCLGSIPPSYSHCRASRPGAVKRRSST